MWQSGYGSFRLGRAAGFHPRYEIPFEGDLHNALVDAKHQVKYVSAIWQR
ncbi:3'-5' exoribonuclease [Cronobacter sakazakii]|nr:3'-5' exoribonuclease [Cronobacter sakazakii]ELY3814957.1 3'-5' exoribonuclease [Cronobacter sakazakii]ELY3831357.1 3'-5' exoribonuclease [Cronobacter sakazakii]